MPPKRRPAAALPPGGGRRRRGVPPRPGRVVRQRPAGRLEPEGVAERSDTEKFEAGEEVDANLIPLPCLAEGMEVVAQGTYWGCSWNSSR
mmetsp:Transcript_19381/g.22775  ORF Transcript_19381/g.22775 Transcript_19381/m.22775 type:complete len:90 (+) Transcript_19381:112-381(+)